MNNDGYKESRNRYNTIIESANTTGMKFTTVSGRDVEVLYGPDDIEHINYLSEIGFPGEYPYTRGIHAAVCWFRYTEGYK